MKVFTVCGFGIGTSLILKMTIDDVLAEEKIKGISVYPSDVASAPGENADLIFTSEEMFKEVDGKVNCQIYVIKNFIDKDEVRRVALPIIKELMNK